MEEDDDLAGPQPGPSDSTAGGAASESGEKPPARIHTQEELQSMTVKQLGRLRAQGMDVDALISSKKKEQKRRKYETKMAKAGEEDGNA
jgi:tRNA (guanine-N(7)-)-methyltransferase subunit TRM82